MIDDQSKKETLEGIDHYVQWWNKKVRTWTWKGRKFSADAFFKHPISINPVKDFSNETQLKLI